MFSIIGRLASLLLLWLLSTPGLADQDAQREVFKQALTAMESGRPSEALAALDRLKAYPLKDYLVYLDLRRRIDTLSPAELSRFLDVLPESFMSDDLRRILLRKLARQGEWRTYLRFDHPALDTLEFRCQRLIARGVEQGVAKVLDEALGLWREAKRLPDGCERLEDWLAASGKLTADLLWKKLEAAMDDGRISEARRLAARLGAEDRITEWQQARKSPEAFLKKHMKARGDIVLHHMLVDAIGRMARKDAVAARATWLKLAARERMSDWARHDAECDLAVQAARQHLPDAYDWFKGVPASAMDDYAHAWKMRAALRAQRWKDVLAAIQSMPAALQEKEEWRYWRARALAASGQEDAARAIWRSMAQGVSYYGLLAADWLGLRYDLDDIEQPPEAAIEAQARREVMRRAREFYALGMLSEARKEWQVAIRDLDAASLRAAAHLAARWGWMERAAITMGKARKYGLEDLEVRFPLPWRKDVERFARQVSIDDGWMYGVMRRESAFMADVGSSAGAQGLMQLMPATAKYMAKKYDLSAPKRADLLDPATNMRLGSTYLRYLMDKFGDHQVLATAAYNAGPGRVKQWMPKGKTLPADVWVDTVPFTETREYCRAVLHYAAVFEWRLHGRVRPLSARMPRVAGG